MVNDTICFLLPTKIIEALEAPDYPQVDNNQSIKLSIIFFLNFIDSIRKSGVVDQVALDNLQKFRVCHQIIEKLSQFLPHAF